VALYGLVEFVGLVVLLEFVGLMGSASAGCGLWVVSLIGTRKTNYLSPAHFVRSSPQRTIKEQRTEDLVLRTKKITLD